MELNKPDATIFSLISIVSKIDQSDLIKQNTILLFRYSAVQDKAYMPDEFERLDISDQACFRLSRKGAVYCDQRAMQAYGSNGVPFVRIDGQPISCAQSAQDYLAALNWVNLSSLDEVALDEVTGGASCNIASCAIDSADTDKQ